MVLVQGVQRRKLKRLDKRQVILTRLMRLVRLKNDDELGANEENSNLAENGVTPDMVDISHGKSTVEACTSNVAFKMVNDQVNVHSKSKVDEGVGNKSLYEQWKETYDEDPYNEYDFDDCGLIDTQMAFANAFDINLHAHSHLGNFGGYTHTLDSICEETEQDCNSTRRHSRYGIQFMETASQILVTASKSSRDSVRDFDDGV
ncbi:hypothetical protein Tco_0316218 [Tanacetum coccineum]